MVGKRHQRLVENFKTIPIHYSLLYEFKLLSYIFLDWFFNNVVIFSQGQNRIIIIILIRILAFKVENIKH